MSCHTPGMKLIGQYSGGILITMVTGKAEVVEKMEIASVGGALTAPAPKAAAKKVTASAEKKGKEAKGGQR